MNGDPNDLARADRQALLLRTVRRPTTTPWLAVTGAKGGVGKTTIAVDLALSLQRRGHRTLLCDFDPGCGDVDVHLRLHSGRGVEDLLVADVDPVGTTATGPSGLTVLCGRSGSRRLVDPEADALAHLFANVARVAADHDVVVADTGAGLGTLALAVAARADLVLAVATPDPAALTDTYAWCKTAHRRGLPLPRLLLNRVRDRDEALRTAGRFAGICERFLGTACESLGWLRHDDAIARGVALQQPRPLRQGSGGPAHDDFEALTAAALGALPPLRRRAGTAPERAVALS